MKSETSLVALNVRLQEWANQIRDCQNRPHEMDVDTWCEQNHLTRSNYYYRLRKVREACLALHPVEAVPSFVELQVPDPDSKEKSRQDHQMVAVIHLSANTSIEILDNASEAFLHHLLGALKSC